MPRPDSPPTIRDTSESFRLILGEPQFQAGDGSNGDELSKALGLPPELLARTGNADAREQQEARDMNRALWPSTWGYYLEQMMGLGELNGQQPGAFPEAEIDANLEYARQHFLDHVRAGGPLPTLRAGKQPYGILPVTALDLWGAVPEDGKLASRDDAADEVGAALTGLLVRREPHRVAHGQSLGSGRRLR